MRYSKINKDLFLVEQPVTGASIPVKEPLNCIWIIDRSGSMYGELPQVISDLQKKARKLEIGTTISFGWFSSEGGDYAFPIKGFRIYSEKDRDDLDKIFEQNKRARNMTCFSEILEESLKVIADLSVLNPNFSLTFFSDGYPIVNNYTSELKKINSVLSALSGKIRSALLVGYGSYFNRDLMASMAERLGGVLVSAKDLHSFSESMNDFLSAADGASPKQKVILGAKPLYPLAVSLTDSSVVTMAVEEDGSISYSPREGGNSIFYLTSKAPAKKDATSQKLPEAAVYALALTLIQRTNTNEALNLLGALGDVALIKQAVNSFTVDEYTKAETSINDAVFKDSARYKDGRHIGYLPPPNAYCLIDALDALIQDEDAKFLPFHPGFDYKRVGVASRQVEGAPKFNKSLDTAVAIKDLSWNESLLNLSILARIPGTVDLQGDYKKFGFAETYPTHIYRNYALVKDGMLNVERLPVKEISKETFEVLKKHGVTTDTDYHPDGVYLLDLAAIPVMNRAMAAGKTSAKDMCLKMLRQAQLKGNLKVLNYYKNVLNPEKYQQGTVLSIDQQDFLKSNFIKNDGTFSPDTEKAESTDFYYVKSFEVKIKGVSSLPRVEEVIEKMDKGKPLTTSQQLLEPMITECAKTGLAAAELLAWVNAKLLTTKIELNKVRSEIQRTKFAILLGKAWFDEFTSRAENKLTIDNIEYTFAYRDDIKVQI